MLKHFYPGSPKPRAPECEEEVVSAVNGWSVDYTWLLLMGPKPSEDVTPGEPSEGLMTEKGEPRMEVGLLEAELLGCCEDMAIRLPSAEKSD